MTEAPPVMSGSGVPPIAEAGYIESEGYPEGYPNNHEQVMTTENIKHYIHAPVTFEGMAPECIWK